jgi:type II secretory pathway pseudopilin PulG
VHLTPSVRGERGFSMIAVLATMLIGGLLVVASLSLTTGDQPELRTSIAAKEASAAAEAGLAYYLFHLAQDNQYWAKCTTVAAPGPGQPNPVNQPWDGKGSDPRVWRSLPAGDSQYTIELLPTSPATSCDPANASLTMIEPDTGMLRIRATGRAGAKKRSIIATLRRRSFIDYLYFTDFETADPLTYGDQSAINSAQANCVKYRPQRGPSCTVITFINNGNLSDKINGPFHTNDDIMVCGTPTFGRRPGDVIEVSGPAPGWHNNNCANTLPTFLGTWQTAAKALAMPPSNSALSALTQSAYKFTGTTTIRLTNSTMIVTTSNGSTSTKAWPSNGLIYVKSGACGTTIAPPLQDYSEPSGCANVYVSGTYSKSLTIASEKDVVIRGDVTRSGDVLLGLIANNFIRIYHPVVRSANGSCANVVPAIEDFSIDAAMLSLSHSFIADNHSCGAQLGTLSIVGAIAQRFRGYVGTYGSSSTGFSKDYTYDDRLRYREPPFFLEPVATAWRIVRQNEQVPAQ